MFGKFGLCQQLRIMRIFHDRINVARAVRAGFEIMSAFAHAPAIVAALDNEINLLPFILADIACPQISVGAVPTESPRVAKPISPYFAAHAVFIQLGLSGKRIVRWNAIGQWLLLSPLHDR